MNRNLVATARKQLLRRGRALLRAAQGGSGQAGSPGSIAESEMAELQEIHAALERIERGIFGRCEDCQSDVEEAWIERFPWERLCAACRDQPVPAESRASV